MHLMLKKKQMKKQQHGFQNLEAEPNNGFVCLVRSKKNWNMQKLYRYWLLQCSRKCKVWNTCNMLHEATCYRCLIEKCLDVAKKQVREHSDDLDTNGAESVQSGDVSTLGSKSKTLWKKTVCLWAKTTATVTGTHKMKSELLCCIINL